MKIFLFSDSNPYNDPELTKTFVWGKKVEQLKEKGDPTAELMSSKKFIKALRKQRHDEIVAVKERREKREQEKEQMERLKEQMEREGKFD